MVQEVVGFLHRLATASKDCAVAMCRAGAREALGKALEKHSSAVPMAPALLELLSDCEKFTGLHRTLTGSILAGCIQVGLGSRGARRRGALGLGAAPGSPPAAAGEGEEEAGPQ